MKTLMPRSSHAFAQLPSPSLAYSPVRMHAHHQAGDVEEEEGSDVSGSDTPSELLDDDDMYDDDDVRRNQQ